jgi:hypothetical protein
MTVLSFILGALVGFMASVIYFSKRYISIHNLLEDKLLVNDLLKKQIKDLQAKKSKKYYRRKSYNKKTTKQ